MLLLDDKVAAMNKLILSIALLFPYNIWVAAQSSEPQGPPAPKPRFEHEDKCGNPEVESMMWTLIKGTVIKIIDGDTINVLTKDNERKHVDLVAVDASVAGHSAQRMLTELVLNRQVEVEFNPSNIKYKKVTGVVNVAGADVNRELIKAGAARYKEPESYTVSNYTACVYRVTENEAREAKRGFWRSVNLR